jgi:hypothetical protein
MATEPVSSARITTSSTVTVDPIDAVVRDGKEPFICSFARAG